MIKDASIRIENTSISDVEKISSDIFGIDPTMKKSAFGIWVEVFDYTNAYIQAESVLKQLNQKESNKFYNDFDMRPFSVSIELTFKYFLELQPIILQFTEILTQIISSETKKRILLMFNSSEIPFRIYLNGKTESDLRKYYENVIQLPGQIPERNGDIL